MAPILKDLPKASFDKIEFPFTSRSATLDTRTHVHEYPKMAGGAVEKLGRKLWSFSFEVPFHTTFQAYPDLYPGRLDALTERCARLDTAALLVPELGEIRCILTRVERKRQGRILSGENATLTFLEDDLEPFRRTTAPASADSFKELGEQVKIGMVFVVEGDQTAANIEARKNLVSIFSLLDSINPNNLATIYGLQARGLLRQVQQLARATHELLKGLAFTELRAQLRGLWQAAFRLEKDLDRDQGNPVKTYVVPSSLSVGQIAQRLYSTASRGGEILALNRQIRDPYLVPAGTRLTVYSK